MVSELISRYFPFFRAGYVRVGDELVRDHKKEAEAFKRVISQRDLVEIRKLKENEGFADLVNLIKIRIASEDERDFKRFPNDLINIIDNI